MESEVLKDRRNFVVLGNTVDESKYAYKIKHALLDNGYNVYAVPEDGIALDDVPFDIDLLDFCINPAKGLSLLQKSKRKIGFAILQPGAGSEDIRSELSARGIEYIDGCILRELEKDGRYVFNDSDHR